jgi:hypothetical protein
MTWGPIIEHDGKGCPVPVGTMVRDWAELPNAPSKANPHV